GREATFGRLGECTRQLPHPGIELVHCVVALQPDADVFWLADRGTPGGTWVNRRRVAAHRLASGDLVQVGPYAWTFSAADGFLVPAPPIAGVAMEARDLALGQRLAVPALHIGAGQFVAIIGASGAGKSTLLK